ncbi:MAG: branched-chain amino acid ABC transporter permease [Parvibaculaceae bacterium]
MSFEVVASSRLEEREASSWRFVVNTGLQMGGIGLALALVGILTMFNNRPIIVDFLTLGYATLGVLFLVAGILVGSKRPFRRLPMILTGGAAAGAIAAILVAILPVTMSMVNLRSVFLSLDRPLLDMLTFYVHPPALGILCLIASGPLLGIVGVLVVALHQTIRRPISGGIIAAGLAGLFQELIRPILANSSVTKPVHDLLYTYTGLKLQGAIIIFAVAVVAIAIRDRTRDEMSNRFNHLPPATRRTVRWSCLAAVAILAALFPLYAGNFVGQVLLMVGLFILMGMGLNLEVGIAGLLDLGFVAFYAVGAYTTALLMADSPFALAHLSYWEAMPVAILASVVVGVIFGIPVLKVRGDYLAVATLGLGEIVRVIVLSDAAAPLLAGAKGILQIPRPTIGGFTFSTPVSLFYLALIASIIAAYVAWRLEESRLGRAWKAIRDDEDVAQALGINLIRVKLLAYGMGAAFAGLAGSIFAVMLGTIYPHSFQLIISINILALIIVGGMGSLPGVALGAAVLIGLPEALREFGEFRFLFYGLAIIVVMRLKPEGLWPSAAKRREMQIDAETATIQSAGLHTETATGHTT